MWYVYIIKSLEKNWYYTGSTNRLENRLSEHNDGKVFSTKRYRPLKLVFTKEFESEHEARAYEQRLKKQRREKERIIREIEK